jgi:hypothetical protein
MARPSMTIAFGLFVVYCTVASFDTPESENEGSRALQSTSATSKFDESPATAETPPQAKDMRDTAWSSDLAHSLCRSVGPTAKRAPQESTGYEVFPRVSAMFVDGYWNKADHAEPMELPFKKMDSHNPR